MLALQDNAGKLDWLLSVDSTIVRAHQHAAGAPRASPTGAQSNDTIPEPDDHGIGQSRTG
jgi:hypothetical protein